MTPIKAAERLKELREKVTPEEWATRHHHRGCEPYVASRYGVVANFSAEHDADFSVHAANHGEAVAQEYLDAVEVAEDV